MDNQAGTEPTLIDATVELFQQQFGSAPAWAAIAPGRVNLIGEHTDYNQGFVLPMAIERSIAMVAGPAENGRESRFELFSREKNEFAVIPLGGAIPKGKPSWANYARGVLAGFRSRGISIPGVQVVMASDVPLGGGLSSSAAFEVATATLVEAITGHRLDPLDKALVCQEAEHTYAGMPCGLMDMYTSVFGRAGHLVLLDCRSQTSRLVPLDDPEVEVLIADTNVKHELTGSEYSERRSQCEEAARILDVPSLREATLADLQNASGVMDSVVFRRARHVLAEIDRTLKAAESAERRDWPSVGRLMAESHRSLRDDYEVSCPELDALVEAAWSIGPEGGVLGSRMTGGGFGGCTVSLVRTDRVENVAASLRDSYVRQVGIEPTIFATRPADGARIVDLGEREPILSTKQK